MTPGTYLRMRREAAGVTIEQLLSAIGTVPRIPEHERLQWLLAIEGDTVIPDGWAIMCLRRHFAFDSRVLDQLIDIQWFQAALPVPRLCRTCACSEFDPCFDYCRSKACGWAEHDLCTTCAPDGAAAIALPVPANCDGHRAGAAA